MKEEINNRFEPASPIIKKIALDYLKRKTDESVSLRDIKNHVAMRTGHNFSQGSYSGAIRDLVDEMGGRIVNTDRGYYMYVGNVKANEINSAIDGLIKELNQLAYVNILKTSREDIEIIKEIPRMQDKLRDMKLKIDND